MKCTVNKKLAEVIREWASNSITAHQPSLSYEINGVDDDVAVKSLVDEFESWGVETFIFITSDLDKLQVQLIDKQELKNILNELREKEMTVSVIDPSMVGGCTVDFDNEDDGLCLLVAAWGEHENMSTELNSKYPSSTIFRGN